MSVFTSQSEPHRIVGLLTEFCRQRGLPVKSIGPGTVLSSELGLDSLARLELIEFLRGNDFPPVSERAVFEATTVTDLLRERDGDSIVFEEPPRRASSEEVSPPPPAVETLVGILQWHATHHPDAEHVRFIKESGETLPLTYIELLQEGSAIARTLTRPALPRGSAILMIVPPGLEFLTSFVGVLLAGHIPVPIYPPTSWKNLGAYVERNAALARNCEARAIVTTQEAELLASEFRRLVPELTETIVPGRHRGELVDLHIPSSSDTALIQYTSGSTGDPKGVTLSHKNLVSNIKGFGAALRVDARDVCVSWLPLYHDMGLIGAWMGSLYHGCRLVLMSPLTFLASPARWLKAISDYRGTISAAPNFAYQLAASKVSDATAKGLDLSSWRAALNGAEPIYASTLRAFEERFAVSGFTRRAWVPVYGLAENSLAVCVPELDREPRIDSISRTVAERDRRAQEAPAESPDAVEYIGCGRPVAGTDLRVVDDAGFEVGDRTIGNIEFRGTSATRCYHKNEAATGALFHEGWIKSGDIGYTSRGDVFVAGRMKDLIIRAGRNIHPHDLERIVQSVPGVRKGGVAAVTVHARERGTERLVVLVETSAAKAEREALQEGIRSALAQGADISPDEVVLIPPRALPKTSSGKLRRRLSAQLYESGRLGARTSAFSAGLTASRLMLSHKMNQWEHSARRIAYGIYFWILTTVLALACLASLLFVRRGRASRVVVRFWTRSLLRLAGISPKVDGAPHSSGEPCVYVANHASYIDAPALLAVVPSSTVFVAKRELESVPLAGWLLRKIDTVFVDRMSAQRGVTDLESAVAALGRGLGVAFFPEGGFDRLPGIRPFRMGPFFAAREANVPIVPVAIRGTRSFLRSDQWFPSWTPIEVSLLPARVAGEHEQSRHLRDSVREEIAAAAGESCLAAPFAWQIPEAPAASF